MAYSCGYWADGGDSADTGPHAAGSGLAGAQRAKLDLVCRKLGIGPGSRLLDVGCGWGSLSLHAAEHVGAHVTGVTIAEEQRRFVQHRVDERGLSDRVEVRLQDYRDVTGGPFDAVASLEMGEHVGERNYLAYVRALHDNVRPGGRVLVQQMSRRGRHPGGGPFIEAFIAPDMHMRPVGRTVDLIERGGLEVSGVVAMGPHYVRTIRAWEDNLAARWQEVVTLVGEESARVWRLYLAGGRLAFAEGRMDVHQVLAQRRG
jgi:cyclopropane-fatty-acyl-phospholipid synthase